MKNRFVFEESLGYLIGKTSASMKMSFNRLTKESGINATVEQWILLNTIHASPGITQSDIALKTGKDKTNITRMLDVLEKNGSIERKSDKSDRRVFRIFMTEKGESLLKKLIPLAVLTNEKAVTGLTKNEINIFKEILYKIFCNNMNG
jgi:MarR family transcriptional regulator, organic hydroperoxide resistance regulator